MSDVWSDLRQKTTTVDFTAVAFFRVFHDEVWPLQGCVEESAKMLPRIPGGGLLRGLRVHPHCAAVPLETPAPDPGYAGVGKGFFSCPDANEA